MTEKSDAGAADRFSGEGPEELLRILGTFSQIEPDMLSQMQKIVVPLEELVKKIAEKKDELNKVKHDVLDLLPNYEDILHSTFGNGYSSVRFLAGAYKVLSDAIIKPIDQYLHLDLVFKEYVAGKLTTDSSPNPSSLRRQHQAGAKAMALLNDTVQLYMYAKVDFPKTLDLTYKSMSQFNKYLQSRFVKSDDDPGKMHERMLRFMMHQEEEQDFKGQYVKIKLVDGNPVLTDILLKVIEELPRKHERMVEKKTEQGIQKKKIRELEEYALRHTADELSILADSSFLNFARGPEYLFQRLGAALQTYHEFFNGVQEIHEKIIGLPQICLDDEIKGVITRAMQDRGKKTSRIISKIRGAYFDPINQREEEHTPDNKKERDHFTVREKLLSQVLDGLLKLSLISDDRKDKIARQIAIPAIDLKMEIEDILISFSERKLQQDKMDDNEYYEGQQGSIHAGNLFYFARKPTPTVKIGDVIGQSFDEAKKHLAEIIENGKYPHLMKITAPGHKLRSNMIIIGPYGCGKTELMRAACADPRIIGATCSISSTLTAYMHESVNNVARLYDGAKKLYVDGREQKNVLLGLDEFDAWFMRGSGNHSDLDMQQIELALAEKLDGMGDYHGIFTIAMTNEPLSIPARIMRRFRYVDIVGELTKEERSTMLKMYMERSLPVHESIDEQCYGKWAEKLAGAPGDVVRKVVDEIHFCYIGDYLKEHGPQAEELEKELYQRVLENGNINYETDGLFLREKLRAFKQVTVEVVDDAVRKVLKTPANVMQIEKAKKMYRDARRLLDELGNPHRSFGLKGKQDLYDLDQR